MKTPPWFVCFPAAMFVSATCWAKITAVTDLTPATVPDGQLPSGYSSIIFNIAKGDEPRFFRLPERPDDGDWVLFASSSDMGRYVLSNKLNLPLKQVKIQACGYCNFRYSKSKGQWSVSGSKLKFYSSAQHAIPAGSWDIAIYDIKPGDAFPRIGLPASADDKDLIIIRSASSLESRIDPDGLLYASTAVIKAGDVYALRYVADFKKWAVEKAPERPIDLRSVNASPSSPRSIMRLTDDLWIPTIKLPPGAGDRDRITIRSATSRNAWIDPAGIEKKGAFGLSQGQEYTFMYLGDKQRWVVMDAPDTVYTAADLKGGVMPSAATPRAIYVSDRKTFIPSISLPKPQQKGARIAFKGEAARPFTVLAPSSSGEVETLSVEVGETPALVSGGGRWLLENHTIDLLGIYSDQAAADYGDGLMRAQLFEEVMNTNHALENSGAEVRVRLVGMKQIAAQRSWTDIDAARVALNNNAEALRWRDEFKADLIHYEGVERRSGSNNSVCGTASGFLGASYPVSTGSATCGTKTLRHELGHQLNLSHANQESLFGGRGYAPAATIMSPDGGSRPFYSTPNRYTQDYGIPMGVRRKYDAVDTLNATVPVVADYR